MSQAPLHSLHYPFPEIPAPGTVRAVAPGVFWVRMPLPFNLNHINLWVLADGDGWTVVDTGINRDSIRDLWQTVLAGLGGRPVRRLIGTHFHPDHVGLGRWFAEALGAELWMTQEEWLTGKWLGIEQGPSFDTGTQVFYHAAGMRPEEVAFHVRRGNGYLPNADGLPHAFRRMVAGQEIDIGGISWRVIVGRGHCPEHACLYAAELGVLIGGDQVLPRITPNVSVWPNEPEGDPLRQFLGSIPAFRGLPAETLVLPSHGLPYRGLETRLDQLVRHHDERLATALSVSSAGPATARDVMVAMFGADVAVAQMHFAIGESLAHLHYLLGEGALNRTLGEDGVHRFQARAAGRHPAAADRSKTATA